MSFTLIKLIKQSLSCRQAPAICKTRNSYANQDGAYIEGPFELEARVLYSAVPIPVDVFVDASTDANDYQSDNNDLEIVVDSPNSESFAFPRLDSATDSNLTAVNDATELTESVSELVEADVASVNNGDVVSQLIFVDENVQNWQDLVADLKANSGEFGNIDVVVIEGDRDGIEQISESLAGYRDVSAVHVVSHGDAGQVNLGNALLNANSLTAYSGQISGWNNSLSSGADLLFYGCDFASTDEGRFLAQAISELCDCDVAVSDDVTGHETLGGDWELEFQVGAITTDITFSVSVQQTWFGVLPQYWYDSITGAPRSPDAPSGDDLYMGDSADNTGINAEGGDDTLYGNDGNDELYGGGSDDLILGGDGDDTLDGEGSNDTLHGGLGDDTLIGGSGSDVLISGGGSDYLDGGNSSDLFLFSGAQDGDVVIVVGGSGTNTIDLTEFGPGTVTTVNASTLSVDLGGGESFTISHSEIDVIRTFADGGNHAPDADAGVDQSVAPSSLVTLDASGSSDPDPQTLTYSWQQISGPFVTLSDNTAAMPTFTAPGSIGILEFALVVSDGSLTSVDTVSIDVGSSNIPPVIVSDGGGATAIINHLENQSLVSTVAATDADLPAQTLSYSITGGADQALFGIDSVSGAVSFVTAPNFEAPGDSGLDNNYEITVSVNDGVGGSDFQDLTITVTNVDDPSEIDLDLDNSSGSFNGNFAVTWTELLGPVTIADSDAILLDEDSPSLTSLTVTILNQADGASETLAADVSGTSIASNYNSGTGVLTLSGSDSIANYQQVLRTVTYDNSSFDPTATTRGISFVANDGSGPGMAVTTSLGIILENGGLVESILLGNEPPFSDLADSSYEIKSDQPWGQTFNYTSGVSAYSVYKIGVVLSKASDTAAGQVITLSIRDSWTGIVIGSASIPVEALNTSESWYEFDLGNIILNDGQDYYIRLDNSEPDGKIYFGVDDSGTYADGDLVNKDGVAESGKDAAFRIIQVPNTAPSLDAGRSPVLNSVTEDSGPPTGAVGTLVSDLIDYQSPSGQVDNIVDPDDNPQLGIAITNVDTSNGSWWYSLNDGGSWVAMGSVSDANARLLSAEGNARVYFEGDSNFNGLVNGAITFRAWDQTTGADGATAVTTTNGSFTAFSAATDTASINVLPENDDPTISSDGGGPTAAINVDENSPVVTTVIASDVDGTPTYSITGGADQGLFAIDLNSGNLIFLAAPDFETPMDIGTDNIYEVEVTADDGDGGTDTQQISVAVDDVNEAPTEVAPNNSNFDELTDTSGGISLGFLSTTDPDASDTFSYNIITSADSGAFSIGPGDELFFNDGILDFESQSLYSIVIRVTDSGLNIYNQLVNVSVNDLNEAPTMPADGNVNVTENTISVGTFAATGPDPDGDTLTYSLSGADAGLFSINSVTGEVTFLAAPNFESPADVNSNNDYEITVTATDDGTGTLSDSQNVTVTVTNANDAPVITGTSFSIAENTTGVGVVTVNDEDLPADTLTWSITSGGPDDGLFTINSSNGSLSFVSAPDFESPLDAGANNIYDVEVQVFDGLTTDIEIVSVTVNDAVEGSVLVVDTALDILDGDTSSIGALLADKGTDGLISLREAIMATNNTANLGVSDVINFNIADGTASQWYYADDAVAGTVTGPATAVPVGGEAAVLDFDPDHPHSWFRIDLDNTLPQLTVSDEVFINGYSQWGASQNTLSVGDDAVLRIELTNSAADGKRGLTLDTGANGSTIQGLVINDFGSSGIMVEYDVHNITVQGNFIGTDVTGTLSVGNADGGIQLRSNDNLIGGSNVEDRNIISGNDGRGVVFYTSGTISNNTVENNYIGVDASGIADLGNDRFGIQMYGIDNSFIINNVISGNDEQGILFRAGANGNNNTIQGNMIGVGADGTTEVANGLEGILFDSDNASGNLIGGTGAGEGNIIGWNGSHGISFNGSGIAGNSVYGNSIGTDVSGLLDLGNGGSGVLIVGGANGLTIGGVGSGEANVIANNNFDGVAILTGSSNFNTIRGNVLKDNNDLAIDIVGINGVNGNDPMDVDSGPNQTQNYPVLTTAKDAAGDLTINGNLNSTPSTNGYIIDFYWSPAGTADPSLHGEAHNYIGSITVNTNGSGDASFSPTFVGAGVPAGAILSATATDPNGNTSEFALNIVVVPDNNAPAMPADTAINVTENTASVGTFSGADPDGDTLTYSLSGTDAALFSINSSTGEVTFLAAPDFESPGDADSDNDYEITVTATDDGTGTLSDSQNVTVSVTDVNEAPTMPADIGVNVVEKTTTVGTFATSGPDPDGDILTYSLSGADAAMFSINSSTGEVTFLAAPNFETPGDTDSDNDYEITVTATDDGTGTLSDSQNVTVTVTDANEAPTVSLVNIVSNIDENYDTTSAVKIADIVVSDDATGINNLTLSGADAADFEIIGNELFLRAGTSLDFETNSVLDVNVDVDDASIPGTPDGTASHSLIVDDINEAPSVSLSGIVPAIAEDIDTTIAIKIADIVIADDALGTNDLSLSGADAGLFEIVGTELFLKGGTSLDFETMPLLDVTVEVDDSAVGSTPDGTASHSLSIIDANDAPTVMGPESATRSEDNPTFNVDLLNNASDVDAGDVLSVDNLTWVSGDNSGVSLSGNDLTIDTSFYQHLKPGDTETIVYIYDVEDLSGASVAQSVSIVITGANDAPVVSTPAPPVVVNEDDANTTIDISSIFTDVDNASLSYSIVSNDSPSLVDATISGSTVTLDYLADQFGSANVVVRATDTDGATEDHTLLVTVNSVNDAPVASDSSYSESITTGSIAGNVLAGASDIDSAAYSATLVSGPTNGTLSLNSDGTFVFTPASGFVGTDSFQFVATDGSANSTIRTVTLFVTPAPAVVTPPPVDDGDTDDDITEITAPPANPPTEIDGTVDAEPVVKKPNFIVDDSIKMLELEEKQKFEPIALSSTNFEFISPPIRAISNVQSLATKLTERAPTELLGSLDLFSSALDDSMDSADYKLASAIVSMSGVSIGVVTWILRSGVVAASMMAHLPAWRAVDPLVVLGYSKDDDEEDVSLLDIINGSDAEEAPEAETIRS